MHSHFHDSAACISGEDGGTRHGLPRIYMGNLVTGDLLVRTAAGGNSHFAETLRSKVA